MAAQGTMTFDADTSAVSAKLDRLKAKAEGIGQAFTGAVPALGALTSATAAAAAGAALVAANWAMAVQKIEEAGQRIEAATQNRNQLYSRATDAADLSRMREAVRQTRAQAGVDEGTAAAVQNELEDKGIAGARSTVADLMRLGFDGRAAASSIGKVRDVFGGTGTEVANKLFAGGKTDLIEFGDALAKMGPQLKTAGITLEESVAVLGNMDFKDAGKAVMGLEDLVTGLAKRGFKGSLADQIDALGSRGLTDRQVRDQYGENAFGAFSVLRNRTGAIRDLGGQVGAGQDAIGNQLDLLYSGDETTRRADQLRQQQEKARLAEDDNNGRRAQLIAERRALMDQIAAKNGGELATFAGAPITYAFRRTPVVRNLGETLSTEGFLLDYNREMVQFLKSIDAKLTPKPPRYTPER